MAKGLPQDDAPASRNDERRRKASVARMKAAIAVLKAQSEQRAVANLGSAAGLWKDSRSLGERAFDAAFGKASPRGQSAATFEQANRKFASERDAAAGRDAVPKPRGWANASTQYAAQAARGVKNFSDWASAGRTA